jgi:hypothetical protein
LVFDNTNKQYFVDLAENNSLNIPPQYAYGTQSWVRGFTVLVNGTGANEFNGSDLNGNPFTGNIARWDGNNWIVVHITANNERCAVKHEGRVYEKQSGTWTDISGSRGENHCFHIYNAITEVNGYNATSDGVGTYGDNQAVEVQYNYSIVSTLPANFWTTDDYYKIGAWINLEFPLPSNDYNARTIGSKYGNNSSKQEPATIDANNMHLTRSGKVGFNNSEAHELGTIDGIQFWAKFRWVDINGLTLQGDFKMRCAIYDTDDNVIIQDFTIPFNDQWAQVNLPLSGFKVYRARLPWSFGNVGVNLFTDDLEILNVFQYKNIKRIVIQWQEVYDGEGRYRPEFTRALTGGAVGASIVKLAIDGFCFTKPLLRISAPVTDRLKEPPALQYPNISNSLQLQQLVDSQLELEKFQHKEYTVTTGGKLDIDFGHSFFLNDAKLINDADDGANTIKLVAKRIMYKIRKSDGVGGTFLRTITGIKRIS